MRWKVRDRLVDTIVKFLLDYIPDPRIFPGFLLTFGWLSWLILKVCQWSRPGLSTMLVYSISVGIAFYLQIPMLSLCGNYILTLQDVGPCPPWYRFLSDVFLWFIVIYIVMKLNIRINRSQPSQHSNIGYTYDGD
jgi:hypothetical protein